MCTRYVSFIQAKARGTRQAGTVAAICRRRKTRRTAHACRTDFCLYKKGSPSRSMIHIHVFNAVVVLPHESRHANRTFLRVLRVTNGKILKISQQSAFTFCVSLTSHLFFSEKTHTHTLHASSEPVRGGGPTTILPLHVARPWE